jgi:Zn-dependent metalloprotease
VHDVTKYGSTLVFVDYDTFGYWDNAVATDYLMDVDHNYNSPNAVFIVGKAKRYEPFVSIDILAHEYSHYLNKRFRFSSGLGFTTASELHTAINEGLSDIWGAVLEALNAPDHERWKIGEKPMRNSFYSCLRNMANPQDATAKFPMSSFYGDMDYDNGDGYVKSGVLSHWFYFVVEGDDCFQGIGLQKAAALVFRAQRHYLTPYTGNCANVDLSDIRDKIMIAADDLQNSGILTAEDVVTVLSAFKAVGLYGLSCR